MVLTNNPVIDPLFAGITNEVFIFVLALLVVIFGANSVWTVVGKIVDKYKTRKEKDIDEKRLDFEVDRFNIETMQKAIVSLNEDVTRLREDYNLIYTENVQYRIKNSELHNKNSAMLRYIAKAASFRRQNGGDIPQVDEMDRPIIPEVVELTK